MGRLTKKGDRKRMMTKRKPITERKHVRIGNTQTRVYQPINVPEPTRYFPKTGDMFDDMLDKINAAKLAKRPSGHYPLARRGNVARHATSRLTFRHRLARLGKTLRRIPESTTVDISALVSRPRSHRPNLTHSTLRSRRISNSAIPPSGTGDE